MGSFIGGCPCIARDGRRSRRARHRDSGWPGAGRSGPLSPSRPGVGSRGPRPARPPRAGGRGLLAAVVGPKPWAFHLTNVALHALNAGLVFAVLRRLVTEDDGRAALAGALLFALHPVQSEAVAWASETKDLLSALFSLLAIRQYLVFRERENR